MGGRDRGSTEGYKSVQTIFSESCFFAISVVQFHTKPALYYIVTVVGGCRMMHMARFWTASSRSLCAEVSEIAMPYYTVILND